MPYMCEVKRGIGGKERSLVEWMIDACRSFVETSCPAQKFFIEHEAKKSSSEKMENKIASKGKITSTSSLQKIFLVVNLLINRFRARTISRLNEIKNAFRRSMLDKVMNVGMGRVHVCVRIDVRVCVYTHRHCSVQKTIDELRNRKTSCSIRIGVARPTNCCEKFDRWVVEGASSSPRATSPSLASLRRSTTWTSFKSALNMSRTTRELRVSIHRNTNVCVVVVEIVQIIDFSSSLWLVLRLAPLSQRKTHKRIRL